MAKRKIILILILALATLHLLNYLVYRPILLSMDDQLLKRAEKLRVGMTEQEVEKMMGKPREKKLRSINEAKELPAEVIERIQVNHSVILQYVYYIPVLFEPQMILTPKPTRTAVRVYFVYLDGNKSVCYVRVENIGENGGLASTCGG